MPRSSLVLDSGPEVGKGVSTKKTSDQKVNYTQVAPKQLKKSLFILEQSFSYNGYMNSVIIGSIFDF